MKKNNKIQIITLILGVLTIPLIILFSWDMEKRPIGLALFIILILFVVWAFYIKIMTKIDMTKKLWGLFISFLFICLFFLVEWVAGIRTLSQTLPMIGGFSFVYILYLMKEKGQLTNLSLLQSLILFCILLAPIILIIGILVLYRF